MNFETVKEKTELQMVKTGKSSISNQSEAHTSTRLSFSVLINQLSPMTLRLSSRFFVYFEETMGHRFFGGGYCYPTIDG